MSAISMQVPLKRKLPKSLYCKVLSWVTNPYKKDTQIMQIIKSFMLAPVALTLNRKSVRKITRSDALAGEPMMYPLFGSKNLATAEDLRNVGRKKNRPRIVDSWSLDEVDALRVPILSSASSSNVRRWNAPAIKQIGIYSTSKRFCEQVAALVPARNFSFQCFGLAEQDHFQNQRALNSIDIWLVNVLDEDESPLLDSIMNVCANVSSLFLFDTELGKQSLQKLTTFIQENQEQEAH